MSEELSKVAQSAGDNNGGTENQSKTYTTDQINEMMEQARKEERSKAEQKARENADKQIREAERLRNMSAEEQYRYQLDQRERMIAEKERALTMAENKSSAMSVLADKGLAPSLVDLVVAEDADIMKNNIDLLEKAFKACVKTEVEKRLAGNTPKKNLNNDGTITKEQFHKMSLSELSELKRNEPELYRSLGGR